MPIMSATPRTPRTTSQIVLNILVEARNRLHARGRKRGTTIEYGGRICAWTAISIATEAVTGRVYDVSDTPEMREALDLFARRIPNPNNMPATKSIWRWNDRWYRMKWQVVREFNRAIRDAQEDVRSCNSFGPEVM